MSSLKIAYCYLFTCRMPGRVFGILIDQWSRAAVFFVILVETRSQRDVVHRRRTHAPRCDPAGWSARNIGFRPVFPPGLASPRRLAPSCNERESVLSALASRGGSFRTADFSSTGIQASSGCSITLNVVLSIDADSRAWQPYAGAWPVNHRWRPIAAAIPSAAALQAAPACDAAGVAAPVIMRCCNDRSDAVAN